MAAQTRTSKKSCAGIFIVSRRRVILIPAPHLWSRHRSQRWPRRCGGEGRTTKIRVVIADRRRKAVVHPGTGSLTREKYHRALNRSYNRRSRISVEGIGQT